MSRRRISSGSTFERDMAYSRAVSDGEWVFVSGTTGFDYRTMTIAENVVQQLVFKHVEHASSEGSDAQAFAPLLVGGDNPPPSLDAGSAPPVFRPREMPGLLPASGSWPSSWG